MKFSQKFIVATKKGEFNTAAAIRELEAKKQSATERKAQNILRNERIRILREKNPGITAAKDHAKEMTRQLKCEKQIDQKEQDIMKQLSDDAFFRMSLLTAVLSISEKLDAVEKKLGRLGDIERASEALRHISTDFKTFTEYGRVSIRNKEPIEVELNNDKWTNNSLPVQIHQDEPIDVQIRKKDAWF